MTRVRKMFQNTNLKSFVLRKFYRNSKTFNLNSKNDGAFLK